MYSGLVLSYYSDHCTLEIKITNQNIPAGLLQNLSLILKGFSKTIRSLGLRPGQGRRFTESIADPTPHL